LLVAVTTPFTCYPEEQRAEVAAETTILFLVCIFFSACMQKPAKLAWSVENAYSRLKNNRIDVLDFS
jgi:hypothetical protein